MNGENVIDFKQALKQRLTEARVAAGYDSRRMAALANGFAISSYAGHEDRNGNVPSAETVAAYAKAFGVSSDWLLTGKPEAEGPASG